MDFGSGRGALRTRTVRTPSQIVCSTNHRTCEPRTNEIVSSSRAASPDSGEPPANVSVKIGPSLVTRTRPTVVGARERFRAALMRSAGS